MTVQVLVSTMGQHDHSLVERLNLECDAVVVNQCDMDSIEHLVCGTHAVTWINSTGRGLSRSRNLALEHATADICILADDDEILQSGYVGIVSEAFSRHPDAGIIGFQAEGIEAGFKTYTGSERKVGYLQSMRMASVEIAFRRRALLDNGLRFNELLGSGARYKMGEENTLLFNSLSQGIKIYYVPRLICRIHIGDSTWFTGFDEEYFHSRGAVFTAMSRRWSRLLILQFAIRKYPRYRSSTSFWKAYRTMLRGCKEYIDILADDQCNNTYV